MDSMDSIDSIDSIVLIDSIGSIDLKDFNRMRDASWYDNLTFLLVYSVLEGVVNNC
jgi:hypothetical protein